MQFVLSHHYHRSPRSVKPWHRLFQAVIILLLSIGAGMASPAQAATITVDGTTCTLADAITAANNDTATGGCSAGSGVDTLTLTADEATNTLIAVGEPRVLAQLETLLPTLDVRQPQVMIEAVLVSLSDSQTRQRGVELEKIECSGGTPR